MPDRQGAKTSVAVLPIYTQPPHPPPCSLSPPSSSSTPPQAPSPPSSSSTPPQAPSPPSSSTPPQAPSPPSSSSTPPQAPSLLLRHKTSDAMRGGGGG
ncbi:hypothetical protein ACOMHN_027311 [Nucella lapillus]